MIVQSDWYGESEMKIRESGTGVGTVCAPELEYGFCDYIAARIGYVMSYCHGTRVAPVFHSRADDYGVWWSFCTVPRCLSRRSRNQTLPGTENKRKIQIICQAISYFRILERNMELERDSLFREQLPLATLLSFSFIRLGYSRSSDRDRVRFLLAERLQCLCPAVSNRFACTGRGDVLDRLPHTARPHDRA